MTTTALILAGGKGTRLQPVLPHLPKPMAPVPDKPFLDYLILLLASNGIKNIILSVGYMHETIINYFGHQKYGCTIQYSIEKEPLGTGGALLYSASTVKEKYFLALNGDTYFKINYRDFINQSQSLPFSIALHKTNDTGRYGSVTLDEQNRIIAFREKSSSGGEGFINAGVYHIEKNFLLKNIPQQGSFSLEKNFLPQWSQSGYVYGFPMDGFFIDIGIPEEYERAKNYFKNLEH
jgi:D-glycero-alpha-D-manno-heptose 1-phosphate guanylyltransferase